VEGLCDEGFSDMAAWRRAIELSLGETDVEKLRMIARSRTEPASRVERARILLGYWENSSFFAVGQALGLHHQTVQRCVERAAAEGPMAALDDRPRPGREPSITLEAKAWLTSLSCRKAKELGYPYELWTTRLLARHAREHGPAEGHPCLANTKMAVARVAAPDWSCAGSRGGAQILAIERQDVEGITAGLRHRACASAGH
jgi:transposase